MTPIFPPADRFTYCPGCDGRVHPGQLVVGVGDELWHQSCRAIALHRAGHPARMAEAEETVKRNLAIGQERDLNQMRLDDLRKRAHAIDAVLLGQNENEGVLDSSGMLHEFPDTVDENAELNAIETVLLQLERAYSKEQSDLGEGGPELDE